MQVVLMPIAMRELVKLMENFGYKVVSPVKPAKGLSIVDELLGEFKGAMPPAKTSTEYVKERRESRYGRH